MPKPGPGAGVEIRQEPEPKHQAGPAPTTLIFLILLLRIVEVLSRSSGEIIAFKCCVTQTGIKCRIPVW